MWYEEWSHIDLQNAEDTPLRVPGCNGVPLQYCHEPHRRFVDGYCEWKQVPAITARELQMVQAMNMITDQPSWYKSIQDSSTIQTWHKDVCARYPLISERAWKWCLAELKDKAITYQECQHLRVLDTGTCVCKSDTLLLESFRSSLKHSIMTLDRRHDPKPAGTVRHIVDPLMYPLVYGESFVLEQSSKNAANASGQVKQNSVTRELKETNHRFDKRRASHAVDREFKRGFRETDTFEAHDWHFRDYIWNFKYQALPSEVVFTNDSSQNVRIASYINNVHDQHQELLRALEELISKSIKPWNDCLIRDSTQFYDSHHVGQKGRVPLRILTFGIEWEHELPDWAAAFSVPHYGATAEYMEAQKTVETISETAEGEHRKKLTAAKVFLERHHDLKSRLPFQLPSPELLERAKAYLEIPEQDRTCQYDMSKYGPEERSGIWRELVEKNKRIMRSKQPEPGVSFSYEEWKAGQANNALVKMVMSTSYDDLPFYCPDYKPYTVSLEDEFRNMGLQVIVKIDSIELDVGKTVHSGERWHVSGQANEHIVACSAYVYDSENIARAEIAFREIVDVPDRVYRYSETIREPLSHGVTIRSTAPSSQNKEDTEVSEIANMLGFQERDLYGVRHGGARPYQRLGSIDMIRNRFISWPNVLEHRLEPISLIDPSKPGRLGIVKLYLVDPTYRICSTRNIPPQQSVWSEYMLKQLTPRLPSEIIEMIMLYVDTWTMTESTAAKHCQQAHKEEVWAQTARHSLAKFLQFYPNSNLISNRLPR